MNLRTTWRWLVALVVILAVLAIFISPVVESPRTVLRAKQLAQLIVLALVSIALMLAGLLRPSRSRNVLPAADSAPPLVPFCAELTVPLLC